MLRIVCLGGRSLSLSLSFFSLSRLEEWKSELKVSWDKLFGPNLLPSAFQPSWGNSKSSPFTNHQGERAAPRINLVTRPTRNPILRTAKTVTPDIPQNIIAATDVYESGRHNRAKFGPNLQGVTKGGVIKTVSTNANEHAYDIYIYIYIYIYGCNLDSIWWAQKWPKS